MHVSTLPLSSALIFIPLVYSLFLTVDLLMFNYVTMVAFSGSD